MAEATWPDMFQEADRYERLARGYQRELLACQDAAEKKILAREIGRLKELYELIRVGAWATP